MFRGDSLGDLDGLSCRGDDIVAVDVCGLGWSMVVVSVDCVGQEDSLIGFSATVVSTVVLACSANVCLPHKTAK